MQSKTDEIRECKTESELDRWVQKNIVEYYKSPELQQAVWGKRYQLIYDYHGKSKSTTD